MTTASVLEVIITGNSKGLTVALNQGAASAKTFEKQASTVGQTATKALGGLVVAGAAAAGFAVASFAKQSVESAIDFDRSMTQIAALTDTSSKRLGEMRQNVLALAGETAQAPVDLANAMYFLASAGLSASQQNETLEASAKAAAVGLGQAGDIARITANALNVFADNGLKAVDVTDTLVAAVREGSAEPDEFADALGRVLPIADKAGISFQQVAASLATMSNAGLDVNEGVTALRGTLQALVAPTTQTQKTLADIGLTVDDVVNSLQQNGLIATLRTLDEEAKKNTDSAGEYNIVMRNLVPNVRALTGVFNLTSQEAKKVDQIFKDVTHSTGDLETAFVTTEQAASFRLKKALNDISIEGQQLASDVLPSVAGALGIVADHVKGLSQLLGVLVAFKVGNKLANTFNITADSLGPLSGLFKRAGANLGGLGAVAASGIFAFSTLKGLWDDAHLPLQQLAQDTKINADLLKFWADQGDIFGSAFEHSPDTRGLIEWAGSLTASIGGIGPNLDELVSKLQPVIQEMQAAGLSTKDWNTALGGLQKPVDLTSGSIDKFVESAQGSIDEIERQQDAFRKGNLTFDEFVGNMEAIGISTKGAMELADQSVDHFGKSVTKTGQVVRNFLGMTDEDLAKWTSDVTGAFAEVTSKSDIMQGNFQDDLHKMAEAARLMNQDMQKLRKANWVPEGFLKFLVDQGPSAVHDFANAQRSDQNAMVADWKTYEKNFQGTMDGLTAAIKQLSRAINGVPTKKDLKFTTNANSAKGDVESLNNSIQALPPTTVLNIKVHSSAGSPWPDEALKMHLFDPMQRQGFKKIGDRWTLPLDVKVHSGLTELPSLGSLEKMPTPHPLAGSHQPWWDRALKNLPRLPEGHTRISVNHHNQRPVRVNVDRKRFTDEMAYETNYGRGY